MGVQTPIDQLPMRTSDTYQERVVAAAYRFPDGTVVIGVRHGDLLMCDVIEKMGIRERYTSEDIEQGFVTTARGRFVNRLEGWRIAFAAGQIIQRCGGDTIDGGTLYSDNLY